MPTPIEQALITLLPTLNTLPQELLDLSTSLLTQSRSKAATLKPDEEIGRVFACAHIAVDRLKHRLDVDNVVARPPVPPRIYKKLYGYLDSALTPSTPRTNRVLKDVGGTTPGSRGRRSAAGTPSKVLKEGARSANATPSKTPVSTAKSSVPNTNDTPGRTTRASTKPQPQPHVEAKEEILQLPKQAKPMISILSTALGAPEAEPHITAALAAILDLCGWTPHSAPTTRKRKRRLHDDDDQEPTPKHLHRVSSTETTQTSPITGKEAEEEPVEANTDAITPATLPILLIALSLLITFTLKNTIIDDVAYASSRTKAISSFRNLDSGVEIEAEIDGFLHRAKRDGWLEMEWFADVKAVASASAATATAGVEEQTPTKKKSQAKTPLRRKEKHAVRPFNATNEIKIKIRSLNEIREEEEEEEAMDIDGTEEEGEESNHVDGQGAGLKWGLGTMFQDSVDWLSTQRRKEFKMWERRVRRKCAEIEGEED